MRRSKFWQAFTDEGIKYIAKQRLNKIQFETIFYFCSAMTADNIIMTSKKSELLKSMNNELSLKPKIKAPNFYKNFTELEDKYIIRKMDQEGFPTGFMMNPFITYKTGLRYYTIFANWLNLINAKPKKKYEADNTWIPEQGFTVNGQIMKPYEPQVFHMGMELQELYGYKYQDYFEDNKDTSNNQSKNKKLFYTKEEMRKAIESQKLKR